MQLSWSKGKFPDMMDVAPKGEQTRRRGKDFLLSCIAAADKEVSVERRGTRLMDPMAGPAESRDINWFEGSCDEVQEFWGVEETVPSGFHADRAGVSSKDGE